MQHKEQSNIGVLAYWPSVVLLSEYQQRPLKNPSRSNTSWEYQQNKKNTFVFLFSNFALLLVFLPDSLRKHHPQREDQLPPQQVTKRWAHFFIKQPEDVRMQLWWTCYQDDLLFVKPQNLTLMLCFLLFLVFTGEKLTQKNLPRVLWMNRKKNQTLEGHKHRGKWLQSVCKYIPNTLQLLTAAAWSLAQTGRTGDIVNGHDSGLKQPHPLLSDGKSLFLLQTNRTNLC